MRIGIDIDGVLADFVSKVLQSIGGRLLPADIEHYDMKDQLTHSERQRFNLACSRGVFWQSLVAIPGAKDAVAKIREAEHFVIAVSTPWQGCQTWLYQRQRWLDRKIAANVPIITTAYKELIDVDILIDDKPDTVIAFNSYRGGGNLKQGYSVRGPRAILFSQPWNRNLDEQTCPWRLNHWSDIDKILEELT